MEFVIQGPWFDAHAHLQEDEISHDLTGMMSRWQAVGGREIVCCGIHEQDWGKVLEISRSHGKRVLPCIGLHPWFVHKASSRWERTLEGLLDGHPEVVGIGEIGLDFVLKKLDRDLQEGVFITQLEMAKAHRLPVSIHVRKAWDRLIQILKKVGPLPAGGLVHAYSGSAEMIPQLEKMGLHISFSGSVTHPGNRKARRALTVVSWDRLLLETDSPAILPRYSGRTAGIEENPSDGRPGSHLDFVVGNMGDMSLEKAPLLGMGEPLISSLYTRGWNEPANLWMTALCIAETREVSLDRLAETTRENGLRLFFH